MLKPLDSQRGVTLAELIVTVVVTGIIAGTMARVLSSSIDMYDFLNTRRRAVQDSRFALQRLSTELRQIASPDSILYAAEDSLTFYKHGGEPLSIGWSNHTLRLNGFPLANTIKQFSLKYYNDKQQQLSSPVGNVKKIWRIRIELVVSPKQHDFKLYHEVKPRNF